MEDEMIYVILFVLLLSNILLVSLHVRVAQVFGDAFALHENVRTTHAIRPNVMGHI